RRQLDRDLSMRSAFRERGEGATVEVIGVPDSEKLVRAGAIVVAEGCLGDSERALGVSRVLDKFRVCGVVRVDARSRGRLLRVAEDDHPREAPGALADERDVDPLRLIGTDVAD